MRCFLLMLMWAAVPALGAGGGLERIQVTSDRAPDCSSLKALVASVTRNCKSDDEKAIALYNFCRYAYYHHAYPTEDRDVGALKMLNVYGWSLCGGEHTVLAALYDVAGYKWRYRGWSNPGHTTVEVFYGNRWHYLDTFLKFYCWMPDPEHPGQRTIAGQEDIRANPALVTDQFITDAARNVCYHKDNAFAYIGDHVNWTAPAFMDCGDDLPGLLSGIRSSNNSGSPRGWAGISFDEPGYSTDVNLGPGYSLELDWDHQPDAWYFRGSKTPPQHTCGNKEYRNSPEIGPLLEPYGFKDGKRTWSNGTLSFQPDFHNDAFLGQLKSVQNAAVRDNTLAPADASQPGVVTVEMASPYVVAKATAQVKCDDLKAELSLDGSKWAAVDLANFSDAVAGRYRYLLRLTFGKPIASLELTSIVQHNQQALPYLAPGQNTIQITAADPAALGNNRLAITYAYRPGFRTVTPEQVFDEGGQIAGGQHATWSAQPIVVQTIVDHLPATLEIPVTTPKGREPVYPRMLFLRREVLAPGQSPQPTPAPPTAPRMAEDQTLATLPEPWTMGAKAPVQPAARAGKTAVLLPAKVSFASNAGETAAHHAIRWPKDNKDAWVMLCSFDPSALPDASRLISAKIVVNVRESHDKAPMQAAAIVLDAPFAAGQPFDFGKLGASTGTAIVEKGSGPGAVSDPARHCEIDVTSAVRSWARGKPCNGLAVRIVPNRSVDDGWTVRFTPDQDKPIELQIVTAADAAK